MAMDMKKMKQGLMTRQKEAYDQKDWGGPRGSIIKDEYLERMWRCKEGIHLVDIVPFEIGNAHPTLPPGDPAYKLDLYVHYDIGPNEEPVVCLAKYFNKPCPVCEDKRAKEKAGEDASDLKPKRRTLYNLVVADNDEEISKGCQLWDVAQWNFDKTVSALATDQRTGEFVPYTWPTEEGKTIQFERKGSGKEDTDFIGHRFLDRKYALSAEELASAVPLDEAIKILTYEQLYRLYFGYDPPTAEDRASATGRRLSRDTETERKEQLGDRMRERTRTAERTQQPPAADRSRTRQMPARGGADDRCPIEGGRFGIDTEALAECESCNLWNECHDELASRTGLQPESRGTEPAQRRTLTRTDASSSRGRLNRR